MRKSLAHGYAKASDTPWPQTDAGCVASGRGKTLATGKGAMVPGVSAEDQKDQKESAEDF